MDDSLDMLGLADADGGPVAPECRHFADDGRIPNSPLATLAFRSRGVNPVFDREDIAARFERLFGANGWRPSWRGGVYDYHHYHSIAHEAFGVLSGWGRLRLGGERGDDVELRTGDALVLPAGTGHCHLEASADFLLLAAYPEDQRELDLIGADPEAHDAAVARIARVSRPPRDPLGGDTARWWP
ncbi:cupin domain-containing protein [Halomonas sp. MCCC 1A17488]|uniref:Cupin domain-containing protein n=1 Tax=Billgrantia sulfidoxydans TaxID=2733484 RepID=A0ABX7W3W4_9GAMM|nr:MULTISPECIES: cupin domain-containing protein [Halomonas]MCE8016695.1 cupin domain-containing protein [Halomonas sp. MCCC 1A17488]MCG3240028.1 cupin domain-containing protein [Halomonas sp. MCCC 1A17488]QPP50087.1 cupin domain-containing protein [Halomonas sp. SS10-MC5]QTP53698.1 cupin domain-containing protein [Halomonas sulfidoxydans]